MTYEFDQTVSAELIPVLDTHSGRLIMSSIVHLEMAMSRIQTMIACEEDVQLNYFYEALGIDPTVIGEELGWRIGAQPEVHFGTRLMPNNKPILIFWYSKNPEMLR